MSGLDAADGSVRGGCEWYSTIHMPDEQPTGVANEFHRVLAPNGRLLLAFQGSFTFRQPWQVEDQLTEAPTRL